MLTLCVSAGKSLRSEKAIKVLVSVNNGVKRAQRSKASSSRRFSGFLFEGGRVFNAARL